jgi:hypothetical protein
MRAIDGMTPVEACGIEIKGDNKWITLIQNAASKRVKKFNNFYFGNIKMSFILFFPLAT